MPNPELRLRLPSEELDTWKEFAEEAGLDLSTYVRRCVNDDIALRKSARNIEYAEKMDHLRLLQAIEREKMMTKAYPGRTIFTPLDER